MLPIEDNKEPPFHQDILEPILSHLPLIDLAPASYVSKSWYHSVRSSLRCLNKPKPWLLIHNQNIWSPGSCATHAYDPRSNLWIEIKSPPSISTHSALRSSGSNLLYVITPMNFSFSIDPFRLTWRHVETPPTWRDDPMVALVGRRIVVAGGVCDFEDDDMAVEAYNLDSATWLTCQSMPESLRDSRMSWLLSGASDGEKMYIIEKKTGDMHVFHPGNNFWSGPHNVCPDQTVFFWVTAYVAGQLFLIGLAGGDVQKIKFWKIDVSSFECELIGEMPKEMVEKLGITSSIGVSYSGNMMYIYSMSEGEEMSMCEVVSGGGLRWGSFRNFVQGRNSMTERVVCTCSEVGLENVEFAMRENRSRFRVTGSLLTQLRSYNFNGPCGFVFFLCRLYVFTLKWLGNELWLN